MESKDAKKFKKSYTKEKDYYVLLSNYGLLGKELAALNLILRDWNEEKNSQLINRYNSMHVITFIFIAFIIGFLVKFIAEYHNIIADCMNEYTVMINYELNEFNFRKELNSK